MGFERETSCPQVWDQWDQDGKSWVIQDLAHEDDENAIQMLVDHLIPDEPLSKASNLINDPVSLKCVREVWKKTLGQRMALGCYTDVDGKKTLVGMNACFVACRDDAEVELKGEAWTNVYKVIEYLEKQCNLFDYLRVDKFLNGFGLVVSREFRGLKLGGRILAAREPLCRANAIKGSSSIFTGPASQKLAARAGFTTAYEVTWNQLADLGLKYPREDNVCKIMTRKYD